MDDAHHRGACELKAMVTVSSTTGTENSTDQRHIGGIKRKP